MNSREVEMAAAIDAAVDDVDDELSEFVSVPRAEKPSQVYSIRIPVDRLEQLRGVAEDQGVPPSALMRQWVLERLDWHRPAKREFSVGNSKRHTAAAYAQAAARADLFDTLKVVV
jgi:hypothetical protein